MPACPRGRSVVDQSRTCCAHADSPRAKPWRSRGERASNTCSRDPRALGDEGLYGGPVGLGQAGQGTAAVVGVLTPLDQPGPSEVAHQLTGGRQRHAHPAGRLGDADRLTGRQLGQHATVLFNHFTADDPVAAVRVWEELAGWYIAKTGVDNSTLLQPTSEGPYAVVNYVRLPHGATRFLLAQLSRPSFHTYVRRTLRDNGMAALPILSKPA
jgi:hypothetical protein